MPEAALIPVDPVNLLQAVAHGLFQIVAGPAVFRIAPGDIFLLLSPQRARLLWGHLPGSGPDIRRLDLAIEIGEFGVGTNRLLHLAAGGIAIEARLAGDRPQRAPPVCLLCPRTAGCSGPDVGP